MSLLLIIRLLAWIIALTWLWKSVEALRGLPRVPNLLLPEFDLSPAGEPRVAVIVPARDEAGNIAPCLDSLLAQDYANLHVVAIDDRSEDSTGDIMEAFAAKHGLARLSVLHVNDLPAGWLGKTHAMALGARVAIEAREADYLLFTDADVVFAPQAIRRSLAQAVNSQADHFVLVPAPIARTAGEASLLGFLQVLGLWAARPWKVADPGARDAIGIGAFNMLRTEAYLALGGFEALRMQILEDLTLARRVKAQGMRQRIAFAPGMVTLHWAAGAGGIVKVMTKNLFAVFAFRPLLLLGACAWLTVFWLGPLLALASPATRLPAVLALIAIASLYALSGRISRIGLWTALAFPFSVTLFVYSLLRSMVVTLNDGGVTWRGTFYSLSELRRNVQSLR